MTEQRKLEKKLEKLAKKYVSEANKIVPQGAWFANQFAIAYAYDDTVATVGIKQGHMVFDYFGKFMDHAHDTVVTLNDENEIELSLVEKINQGIQQGKAQNDPKVAKEEKKR